MARVRPPQPALEDLIDVTDVDTAIDDLLDMDERAFTDAVELYLRGDRRGMEIMRHPDVIERLFDALERLRIEYRRKYQQGVARGEDRTQSAAMIRVIEVERRAIRDEALSERASRIEEEKSERATQRAQRQAERLERALARQRELRRQIEEAQAATPRQRAIRRLIKLHEVELSRLIREEREKDASEHHDGPSGPGPPGPSTNHVPRQSAPSCSA